MKFPFILEEEKGGERASLPRVSAMTLWFAGSCDRIVAKWAPTSCPVRATDPLTDGPGMGQLSLSSQTSAINLEESSARTSRLSTRTRSRTASIPPFATKKKMKKTKILIRTFSARSIRLVDRRNRCLLVLSSPLARLFTARPDNLPASFQCHSSFTSGFSFPFSLFVVGMSCVFICVCVLHARGAISNATPPLPPPSPACRKLCQRFPFDKVLTAGKVVLSASRRLLLSPLVETLLWLRSITTGEASCLHRRPVMATNEACSGVSCFSPVPPHLLSFGFVLFFFPRLLLKTTHR